MGYMNVVTLDMGSGTWTVPAGVIQIGVAMLGGGGGGVHAGAGGCGGDSGGLFIAYAIPVMPGQNFGYTVGTGGPAGGASLLAGKPKPRMPVPGTRSIDNRAVGSLYGTASVFGQYTAGPGAQGECNGTHQPDSQPMFPPMQTMMGAAIEGNLANTNNRGADSPHVASGWIFGLGSDETNPAGPGAGGAGNMPGGPGQIKIFY